VAGRRPRCRLWAVVLADETDCGRFASSDAAIAHEVNVIQARPRGKAPLPPRAMNGCAAFLPSHATGAAPCSPGPPNTLSAGSAPGVCQHQARCANTKRGDFLSYFEKTETCWTCTLARTSLGFGQWHDRYVHHVAWELTHGPFLPDSASCITATTPHAVALSTCSSAPRRTTPTT
jgi:hypothetical protein